MRSDDFSSNPEDLLDGLPEAEPEFLRYIDQLRDAGELARARNLLDRALERSPTPELRRTFGDVCIDSEAYESALAILRPLCSTGQPDPTALLMSARASAQLGELEASRDALERAEAHGASRAELQRVRRWLDDISNDTLRGADLSNEKQTVELEPSETSNSTKEVDADFDRLVEASDAASPEDPPPDLQQTSKSEFREGELSETSDGFEEDGNPFDEVADTVPDEHSGPDAGEDSASGPPASEHADPDAPPAVPPGEADGEPDAPSEPADSEFHAATDQIEVGENADEADDEFYAETDQTEIDALSEADEPSDLRREGTLPESARVTSEPFELSTDTGRSGVELEEMLVEETEDIEDPSETAGEAFPEVETEPVAEFEEERDDIHIADKEPTHLVDLPDPEPETPEPEDSAPEGPGPDESPVQAAAPPTREIEAGTADADGDDSASIEPDGSEPTIEIDESLRPDGDAPLRAGGSAEDEDNTVEETPGNLESATEPEVPTPRSGGYSRADDPVDTENAPEDDPPTEPEVPTVGGGAPAVDSEATTDPRQPSGRAASATGSRGERPDEVERPSDGSPPAESPRRSGRDESASARPRESGGRRSGGRAEARESGRGRSGGRAEPRESGASSGSGRAARSRTSAPAGRSAAHRQAPSSADDQQTPSADSGSVFTPRFLLVTTMTAAAIALLFAAVSGFIAKYDTGRLESALEEVQSLRSADTNDAWTKSLDRAHEATDAEPGALRRALHSVGSVFPGVHPSKLRAELLRERAYAAAVVEYRFEAPGSRRSDKLASRAFADGATPELAAAVDVYRLLAGGEFAKAARRARDAARTHGGFRRLDRARLETLVELERASAITSRAESFRENHDEQTVYDRYVLARAALFDDETSAQALAEELIDEYSPDHLGAKIVRVRALTERGELERAATIGRRLVGENKDAAAPYELAQLRIALGDAYRALGEPARAEEQYRAAIEEQPERSSVYLPLTDLLIADGRLGKAREQIDAARSRADTTPALRARQARLEFLEGRFESALDSLGDRSESAVRAPVLRGHLLIELGRYERARTVLNSVASSDARYPAAKSLELVARTRMGVADPESVLDEMEQLRSQNPENPVVLRSAARVRLHFARGAAGSKRRTYLDRAQALLENATDAESERALQFYLLCERHLLADDAPAAARACRKARDRNPKFLPGLLTVANLRLANGEVSKANDQLARLTEEFEARWDVAALRIRAAIRGHDLETASGILDDWLKRQEAETDEFQLYEGLVAFARADYARALGYFDKARDSSRHEHEASLYYAHSLARLGELDEAEDVVRELTRSDRWRAAAWLVFGEVRRRQERERDALENLGLAEKHYDSDFAPPWRLAHLYAERALAVRQQKGWEDSRVLENLRRGKESGDSESPEIQLAFGLYFSEGPEPDLDRAATHLEKVVDIQPHRCSAVRKLLKIYREQNDDAGAGRVSEIRKENCE